jgi:ADP-ribose pyrophosphatase YjhB (NUDIX family)
MEKTGVEAAYLEQLGSFGGARRDPRGWSVTNVYFALMASDDVTPRPGGNAPGSGWFAAWGEAVRETLAFDHAEILRAALGRLRSKVKYTSLPTFLLPAEFTLSQLQRIYEVIRGRSLEKKAFRTRVSGCTDSRGATTQALRPKQAGAALQVEAATASSHLFEAIWRSGRPALRQLPSAASNVRYPGDDERWLSGHY